jgi:eukaryotic-like serine/threonine-protein kinase
LFWLKPENLVGKTLDRRYEVIEKLGRGGFGDTYLVVDKQSLNKVKRVVKHFQPKDVSAEHYPKLKAMFEREIKILEALGEENTSKQIPRVLGRFDQWQEFFYVQEFVDGKTLKHEMRNLLNEAQARQLLIEILEVLAFVHQKGVIHRDLKPDNIMRRTKDRKIILIDFGAVKKLQGAQIGRNQQVESSLVMCTPGYAPNEQMRGHAVPPTDVYAVGIIGIQALTGKVFAANEDGKVEWQRSPISISKEFAEILNKMVQDRPSDRYASATEALAAIKQITAPPNIFQPISTPTIVVPDSSSIFTPISRTIDARDILEQKEVVISINRGNQLELARIPAGRFMMGMPASERKIALENAKKYNWTNAETWLDWSTPQHEVKLPSFLMGKYAITNAQWEAVMNTKPSANYDVKFQGENQPVVGVSWDNCQEFCKKLSAQTKRNVRLPSEAEWEYACRAGTTTAFHFGETITPDLVNYDGNYPYGNAPKGKYRQQTVDVKTFNPNLWGLYQMHGNLWEWCEDVWHDNYKDAPINGTAWLKGGDQKLRALRGGSWYVNAFLCRSAYRGRGYADDCFSVIGFRVVVA